MTSRNILILTDYTSDVFLGGAQLVNDLIKLELERRGHHVEYVRINPDQNEWSRWDGSQDLTIVANIPHLDANQLIQLAQSTVPYVNFRHDIASLAYSLEPRTQPMTPVVEALFANAAFNFFISNIQLAYYQRICSIERAQVIPPPARFDGFDNWNQERRGIMYLGPIAKERGVLDSLEYVQALGEGQTIDFFGKIQDEDLKHRILKNNCNIFPEIPRALLPRILNSYRQMIYLPHIVDAFCIKIIEAELCGIEIIAKKENIGRYYFQNSAQELKVFMENNSSKIIGDQLEAVLDHLS